MPPRQPSATLLALAVLAAIAGTVFALQGLGAPIGQSVMIGDLRWTVIGLVLVGLSGIVFWRRLRRR